MILPESIDNHRVVWRFLDAVVAVLPNCNFYTGEPRLKAITQELRRQGLSSSHYYNADGIIFDDKLDLELGLLETSGPFNVDDPSRETNDFIKAAYGLMIMLHIIAYKYIYADADIFMRPETSEKKKLYVLNRIKSAILCIKPTNSMQDIKNMTNTIWKLKQTIEQSCKFVRELERSHKRNKSIMIEVGTEAARLDDLLNEIAEVKLTSRVTEVDDIYVYSSPLRPESPFYCELA
ncbi:hypothetical protein G6F43_001674 [Rhizopus delemar]|nr:hypothetical protein G6F43_001674 [Rhizopus delemar]